MNPSEYTEVNISEHAGRRYLHLGTEWVQGSMWINKPFEIELEYVQRMMAWLMFFEPDAVKNLQAMQLGLGSGAITKCCYKTLRMKTTAVELNPQVLAACRQWFKLPPEDERLQIILGDAAQVVQRSEMQDQVDAIQVDLYDHEAAAPVLDSEDFYAHVRACLASEGVMSVNLFGRRASFEKSLAKIQRVFGAAPGTLWAFKPTKEGNTIVLALKTPQQPLPADFAQHAALVQQRFELPALKWLRVLRPVG
jgi:spermidine synthase